ncbi:hypothetical protein A2U01_0027774 [Trifolium medium]|uniref:Uncharacterized protein n=1 Tax=Trifolium medium TaxID=97028 RepID=A0A392P4P2_9FABA|nr:hypothetical protein [Trifolium medium]
MEREELWKMRSETVSQLKCIDFLKIPFWRAAPTALRDAQVTVMNFCFEFSTGAPRHNILHDAQLTEQYPK